MNSPVAKRTSIKRSFSQMFSPQVECSIQSLMSPKIQQLTKKKLLFSLTDSPAIPSISTPFCLDDESSCDSGTFDNDIPCIDENSLDTFKMALGSQDSPLTQLNNLQNNIRRSQTTNFFNRPTTNVPKKHKSMKFDDESIKKALEKIENQTSDTSRLIGDFTRPHTLPLMTDSKHKDLASITPSTLAAVINGTYSDEVKEYKVLDARYPYEFEGGHIENAQSAYVKETLFENLFKSTQMVGQVLILHCEFSSERGPKLMREIRERDRLMNQHCYPSLHYPEMYLLEGGYKSFYADHVDMCEPKSYLPMHHDSHRQELKYFRSKSKSWDADTKKRLTRAKLMF